MAAKLIKGTEIREEILEEITAEVAEIKEKHGVVPGLVTILVGESPASISYVTLKIKTAHRVGFNEIQDSQPDDLSEEALLAMIDKYNKDDSINGILVQLPLPKHINEIGGDEIKFPPCTPAGIQEMIVRAGVETSGAEVVVVGRSNIVGKPIANMMFQKGPGANSTVTVVHTRTKDLAGHCKRADILIVAAGVPGLVKPEWIKPGACVIDVGVNRIGEKISEKTGKKIAILSGDVDFDAAKEIAGSITPVPGGVGPMTITMLMKNTLKSLKFKLGIA
ncbi:MAG: bifunctional 5,10-methylene-tetrahydrofolate dehydrogenase/5,10-methylene-tetrahydrofolate cyclohydrolase [Deltaproteobacteria bacterium]|nr:bifunctional 5,10-methylene-tetrahydrofolate dehydrogenase/5,10-methylene-tetrahydrofolate cyclohydrolase [Deltaproteobacteria bacterium]